MPVNIVQSYFDSREIIAYDAGDGYPQERRLALGSALPKPFLNVHRGDGLHALSTQRQRKPPGVSVGNIVVRTGATSVCMQLIFRKHACFSQDPAAQVLLFL